MNRALLQQVLDALENATGTLEGERDEYFDLYGKYPTKQSQIKRMEDDLGKHKAAIEALKAELEKPEQAPRAWIFLQNNELLWPEDVENETPCEITGYVPLYTK